jgi:hypothetical protein
MARLNNYHVYFFDGEGRQVANASIRSGAEQAAAWLASISSIPLRSRLFVDGQFQGELFAQTHQRDCHGGQS